MQTIPITWPFATWGLDLVGPFKKVKGGFTHIFVAVDKFTIWIEVKHATSITAAKVVEFIKEIMYNFAYPTTLSLIMGLSLLQRSSRTFVRTRTSRLTMLRCYTHRLTVKWSDLMA
jgi:hypothetical protein